jgi:hypothetical protein
MPSHMHLQIFETCHQDMDEVLTADHHTGCHEERGLHKQVDRDPLLLWQGLMTRIRIIGSTFHRLHHQANPLDRCSTHQSILGSRCRFQG